MNSKNCFKYAVAYFLAWFGGIIALYACQINNIILGLLSIIISYILYIFILFDRNE